MILSWLSVVSIAGQSLGKPDESTDQGFNAFGKRISGKIYQPPQQSIQGSPFVNENWMAGKIIFTSGDTAGIRSMNYNAFLDELVYLNQALDKHVIIDHQTIQSFHFIPGNGKPVIKYIRSPRQEVIRATYIQELVNDTVTLLAFRKKEIIEDPGYPPSLHPDYYLVADQYFVMQPDSSIIKIKPSRYGIYKTFPDIRKKLRGYIRKHQLYVSDENDLVELVRFINETDLSSGQ